MSSSRRSKLVPEIRPLLEDVRAQQSLTCEILDKLLGYLAPSAFDDQLQVLIVELGSIPLVFTPDEKSCPKVKTPPVGKSVSRRYLKELERFPTMEREDEIRYAKRMEFVTARLEAVELGTRSEMEARRSEYEAIRADFVERNLHLVVSHAYGYRTFGAPMDDLIQEGNAALMRAVEKFDWRHNVRFKTYVAFWIRQAIERFLAASKGSVRVPHHLQQKYRRLKREGKLPDGSERDVTVGDVAKGFGMKRRAAGRLLESSRPSFSLEQEINQDGDTYRDFLIENWEPVESDRQDLLQNRIKSLLQDLDEREQCVIRMRFGLDGRQSSTLEEVGKVLHLSRERSRQIQQRALGKLKVSGELARLHEFL